MTRKELIQYFTGDTGESEIISLHECLYCTNKKDIDKWLKGVIDSLYYKPNKVLLLICGKQNIGKTEFLRRIFPKELLNLYSDWYEASTLEKHNNAIYEKLIINVDVDGYKKQYKSLTSLYSSDGFRISYSNSDKRLASFSTTSNNWEFPKRKSIVSLHLEAIDQDLFNSIDKRVLWQQIFNKYKR